jgi:PKD repeat protein
MERLKGTFAVLVVLGLVATATGCSLFSNQPPVAAFVVKYNTTENPLDVELDASSSSDLDGEVTTYMWSFGEDVDILTPLEETKTVYVPVLLVHYPFEGTYEVELHVIDDRGVMSEGLPYTLNVTVPSIPVAPMP